MKTCQQSVSFRSLPVSPLLLQREKTLHFLLFSPCLLQSIDASSQGCCHPSSPHLALLSQMHPARWLCSREPEGAGCRQRTDSERPWSPWGFLTLSHLISFSLLLMCSLRPSSSLFFLPFSPTKSVFVLISSLAHYVAELYAFPPVPFLFYPATSSVYLPSLCSPNSSCFPHLKFLNSLKDQEMLHCEILFVTVHVLADVTSYIRRFKSINLKWPHSEHYYTTIHYICPCTNDTVWLCMYACIFNVYIYIYILCLFF